MVFIRLSTRATRLQKSISRRAARTKTGAGKRKEKGRAILSDPSLEYANPKSSGGNE